MFRSKRRPVVYPQAEHARLAAAIAAAWGNDDFARPRVPFDAFVRGVALHDRGYGELDADGIGEVPTERWIELQRRSFAPRGEDPVVDLVVALHVHRLVARAHEPLPEMSAALPALREAARVGEADALAADRVTDLCDRISFDFCFEEPRTGRVELEPAPVAYAVDGGGGITLSPWPLGVPRLTGIVVGFRADGYPRELDPVVELFRAESGSG